MLTRRGLGDVRAENMFAWKPWTKYCRQIQLIK